VGRLPAYHFGREREKCGVFVACGSARSWSIIPLVQSA
jgi:hypothetical protein